MSFILLQLLPRIVGLFTLGIFLTMRLKTKNIWLLLRQVGHEIHQNFSIFHTSG